VIAGTHALIFSEDAEATRAFFREVLGFPHVESHPGWLIFELPPAELGIHPGPGWSGQTGQHELFFMCHDLRKTIEELTAKGVEFSGGIDEESFGLVTKFKVPGAGEVGLYEPTHSSPLAEFS